MIHTEFGFSFFKTLLDGPANAAEPHEEFESRTDWGVTDVVCVIPLAAQSPFHNQPDRLAGESIFAQGDASFGKIHIQWVPWFPRKPCADTKRRNLCYWPVLQVDGLLLGFRHYRFDSAAALPANLSFFSGRSFAPAQSIGWH